MYHPTESDLKKVREKVREFASRELTENMALKYESEGAYPDDIRRRAAEELLPSFKNTFSKMAAIEEICRVNTGLGITVLEQPLFGSDLIDLHGNQGQKSNILERVRKGELITGLAVTEPGGGSDVASIKTQAIKSGKKFILNGSKMFITNGNVADYIIVLARTSLKEEKKHRGMTLLIVDTKSRGFSSNRLKGKMGVRPSVTSELFFEEVEVPEDMVLGEEGKGFYHVMDFFNRSRINVAAMSVGTAEGAFDKLLSCVMERRTAGDPDYSNEGIIFDISELATRIYAARKVTYEAAEMVELGDPDPMITSMAKKMASEAAVQVSKEASKLMGPDGILGAPERFLRDSKIMDIWEGTSEIENLVIGRSILKKGGFLNE